MLYWFAAQQQTSIPRPQKFDLLYSKFSPDFNEFSPAFQNQQEVAKKWLTLKQSRKPHVCGIRRLRVNVLLVKSYFRTSPLVSTEKI